MTPEEAGPKPRRSRDATQTDPVDRGVRSINNDNTFKLCPSEIRTTSVNMWPLLIIDNRDTYWCEVIHSGYVSTVCNTSPYSLSRTYLNLFIFLLLMIQLKTQGNMKEEWTCSLFFNHAFNPQIWICSIWPFQETRHPWTNTYALYWDLFGIHKGETHSNMWSKLTLLL